VKKSGTGLHHDTEWVALSSFIPSFQLWPWDLFFKEMSKSSIPPPGKMKGQQLRFLHLKKVK
jgi:hypothetical protein